MSPRRRAVQLLGQASEPASDVLVRLLRNAAQGGPGRGPGHDRPGGQERGRQERAALQAGINFNDLPLWQRRGTGLYWERYEREGYKPKREQKVITTGRRVKVDRELPMGDEYGRFIEQLLRQGVSAGQ
jgi:hypothetical protein